VVEVDTVVDREVETVTVLEAADVVWRITAAGTENVIVAVTPEATLEATVVVIAAVTVSVDETTAVGVATTLAVAEAEAVA
jgi:hypothetical protein